MKYSSLIPATLAALLTLTACSDEQKSSDAPTAGAMKCGAGKCGAAMVDGDTALAKKQRNILAQMSPDDPRMGCVMNAKNIEALYDCVRDPATGKLTLDYNRSGQ